MTFFPPRPLPAINKRCCQSRIKLKKKLVRKEMMSRRVMELKEISQEQKMIKQGQRLVGQKLECEKLRKETNAIIQQTTHTQLRLALMFQILKARLENDFTKASQLNHLLREIIAISASS